MLNSWRMLLLPGESQRGATLVEYSLIILLIAVALVLAVTTLGNNVEALYTSITDAWPG